MQDVNLPCIKPCQQKRRHGQTGIKSWNIILMFWPQAINYTVRVNTSAVKIINPGSMCHGELNFFFNPGRMPNWDWLIVTRAEGLIFRAGSFIETSNYKS